jgi:hypothetical protein
VTYPATGANSTSTTSSQYGTTGTTGTQYKSSTNQSIYGSNSTMQSTGSAITGVADTQVTTVVRQLDAQGPAVVQRIQTQLGDLACSQDTVQQLVDALHSGKSVTITSNVNGQTKSSTFNASNAHLGYGEAYIALALAAEQLRNAGVSGCATPEQWQAVLLGGPLNVSSSTNTSSSSSASSGSRTVPGIVTLHTQGQGWGQIAKSSNVQLNQIISNAGVSSTSASNSTSSVGAGAPTGYSSADMNNGHAATSAADDDKDNGKHKGQKKHHWFSRDKDKDNDKDASSSANSSSDAASTSASSTSGAASTSASSTR